MKKLMIAAAIVCAAAVSQAAAVTWNTGKIYGQKEGGALEASSSGVVLTADNGGKAYLFVLGQDATAAADYAALATSKAIFDAVSGNTLTVNEHNYTAIAGTSNGGGKFSFSDMTDYGVDKNLYAILLVTHEVGGTVDYYSANGSYIYVTQSGASDTKAALKWGDGTATSGYTATVWTANAVPEPTSGLLLLLGVAGLALRRRHA